MNTIPPIKIKKAADGKRTSNIVSNPTSIKALVVHFRFFAVFQSIEPTRPGRSGLETPGLARKFYKILLRLSNPAS